MPKSGFDVVVVEDGGRGVDERREGTWERMEDARAAAIAARSGSEGEPTYYRSVLVIERRSGRLVFATDNRTGPPGDEDLVGTLCPACDVWVGMAIRSSPSHARCPRCRAIVTIPAPILAPESDRMWVEQYGSNRLERRGQWLYEAARRTAWLETELPPPADVLELGCASGEFTHVATARGYAVTAVEPNAEMAAAARDLTPRATIQEGILEDLDTFAAFDAVAAFHVLEHLDDPVGVLERIARHLRPGGLIVVETPNGDALGARLRGVEWEHAMPKEHVTLPTARSLQGWMARAGFGRIRTSAHTQWIYDRRSIPLRIKSVLRGGSLDLSRNLLRASGRTRHGP